MQSKAIIIALLFIAGASCSVSDNIPFCYFPEIFTGVTMQVSPAVVDVQSYMGTWFEQARMPAVFQIDCICASATYSLNPAGYVNVHNACYSKAGKERSADAKAYSRNANNTKLNVYFSESFNIPGSYWILDIAEDYSWVVVGEPCRTMAWILSRVTQLDQSIVESKIALLQQKGYDVSKIIKRDAFC